MPKDNIQPPRWSQSRRSVDGFFGPTASSHSDRRKTLPSKNIEHLAEKQRERGIHGKRLYVNPTPSSLTPKPDNKPVVHTARTREPLLTINPESLAKQAHQRKWHTLRRRALKASLIFAAIIVLGAGALLGKGYLQLHHIFGGGGKAAALEANVNPNQLKGEGSGRVNILLLGIGGGNHDGPDLTDTIIIASIDPVNHKAGLLSIPRDLWVKMPNNFISNYQKINAAYESGKYEYLGQENSSNSNTKAISAGFQAANSTISRIAGIPINYDALVDFQAFQQAVDTVGGITINVPTELYDPTMAWQNNWNPVIAPVGIQTMNGYKALLYVRSRETTSDFARAQRQRAVLLALKQKVLTLGTLSNPVKISGLMSAFGDNVRTNISLSDAEAIYSLMKKISNKNVVSVGLGDGNKLVTTAMENGISVVEPTAGPYDYSQIQSYVRNQLRDGYIAKENAKIMVLNGTTVPGLANQFATVLKSYGYYVGSTGNAPTSNYQKTVIVDRTNGKDKYTSHYLENRFHVKTTGKLPSNIKPNGSNFVIILGDDEANSSQT